MAWYYGTYSCGHDGRTNVCGPTKDRQRIADWRFDGLCPDCYKKQQEEKRAKENAEAAEKSAEMELPELKGTEKQVAWANTIRLQKLEKIFNDADRQIKAIQESQNHIDKKSVAITMIKNALMHFINDKDRTTAWWWIDEKDSTFRYDTILKYYSETSEGAVMLAVINGTATADEIAAVKAEMGTVEDVTTNAAETIETTTDNLTVISDDCETKKTGIVKIKFNNSVVSAEYIKDNDFIEIVKSLHYKWNGSVWSKEITEYTGNAEERIAELGNKLLTGGFTVNFPDIKSKEKAVSAEFEPENDRWIKYNTVSGKLAITWHGINDYLYTNAKKLPGAKWNNGSMKVKIEFYKEVEDFAEVMGFSISQMATQEIAKYKQKENTFEVTNVSIKNQKVLSDNDKLKKVLKSEGTIIDDLIDD